MRLESPSPSFRPWAATFAVAGMAVAALALGGCPESASRKGSPTARPPAAADREQAADEPDGQGDPDERPTLDPKELEQMSRTDLEAACFEGSTAACDALGH